jgi:uncharacterized membrane protein
MERKVGDFVTEGQPLLSITAAPREDDIKKLNKLFEIGHYRTVEQDIGVGIRQLVDIALRALSPALNDPATAAMCIDFLSAILARLASRQIDPDICFSDGKLRVITRGPDFDSFLSQSFDLIREHAQDDAPIYLRLLTALETIAGFTRDAERRRNIASQVRLTAEYANLRLTSSPSLARIEQHQRHALAACG